MIRYTKKEVEKLFENGLEFWYIGLYDWEKRIDSRRMSIDYILEYIQEMLECKYYKTIDLYYWWIGQKHKLSKQKDIDTMYSVYECLWNWDFVM